MSDRTFTLSEPLDQFGKDDRRLVRQQPDLGAPLPLGYPQVVQRARQIRHFGYNATWPLIARIMGEYHGFWRGAQWWAEQVKAVDPTTKRPRGTRLPNDRYGGAP